MGEHQLAARLVVPVLVALFAGALAWLTGLDGGHVAVVTLGVFAVGGVARVLGALSPAAWPQPPDDSSGTGCHLVALQSRALQDVDGDRERFEHLLSGRLRVLTAARLRSAGHDPAGPRARPLLGGRLFDPLRRGTAPRHPEGYVERLLDRLDEIDPPTRPVALRPEGRPDSRAEGGGEDGTR